MSDTETAEFTWVSRSLSETERLGRSLAAALEPGDVVALVGSLGAGKTQLVRAVAAGLGVEPAVVSSPTFVIVTEYEGRVPVVHVDAYRLEDLSDLDSAGWSEELLTGAVTLIEWADRIAERLPADRVWVELEHVDPESRRITVRATGEPARRLRDPERLIPADSG